MNFSDWYENNKEAVTQTTIQESLRRAWQDGYCVATREMYKQVVDGMRGSEFRQRDERGAETEAFSRKSIQAK